MRRGLSFLFSTLTWTWSFWFAIAFLGRTTQDPLGRILYYVGGAGPLVMAITFLFLAEEKETRRDFCLRVFTLRNASKRLIGIALLLPVIFNALAVLSTSVIHGKLSGYVATYVDVRNPVAFFIFLTLRLVLGPIPEEIGWRGYALDNLQKSMSAVLASVTVWLFWWLWHLPLYFIHGTYQNRSTIFSEQFLVFALGLLAESFLFTWLYYKSGRNILTAILFHFSINTIGELLILTPEGDLHRLVWSWIATTIAIQWLSRTQGKQIVDGTLLAKPTR